MIDPLFSSTALNVNGILKAEDISRNFTKLLQFLEEVCPKGREFAIARTKLEEASFYAKKSLVTEASNRA
jgi:hypothetical protein